uniref:Large ribosomal subunit protein uL22c n=1 Tax=Monotropa uniflora TaxID=50148 RepID=A0A1B0ZEY9_MONUN|nr:ribosomal protein L22 [Monotropa uniflora]ASN78997.1 ribosomal protein L22 [Monotropa uniflora]
MLNKRETQAYALGRYMAFSAQKARRVIDKIRGHSYAEALIILDLMPYRAAYPILKLVLSAKANAILLLNSDKDNLIISKAYVNEGTIMKRFKSIARSRGHSYPIKRPTCHIRIVVKDISL